MDESVLQHGPGWQAGVSLLAKLDVNAQAAVDRADPVSRQAAMNQIIDAFGCLVRGATHPTVRRAVEAIGRQGESGTACSLADSDVRVAAPTAVGLDALACHADEFDGVHPGSGTVPLGVVVPTALTLGSWLGESGEAVVDAVIAGVEVMVEAALAKGGHRLYQRSWWPTLVFGALGAATTSAHLLGLNDEQRLNALSLSAGLSGGLLTEDVFLDAHYCNYGEVAARGVRAAFLAEGGARGSMTLLDGPFDRAFHTATADAPPSEHARITECVLKEFPCAMSLQVVVQAIEELANGRNAADITRLAVTLPESLAAFISNEACPGGQAEAATSLQFVVAAALDGEARNVWHFRRHDIGSTARPVITLETDPELEASSHALPIRLAMSSSGGSRDEAYRTYRPARAASREKYEANVHSDSRVAPSFQDFLRLDDADDIAVFLFQRPTPYVQEP